VDDSLFSPHWFRVQGLHPQLRPQVLVRRQVTRGRVWYVLHNQANGRFHRINAQAYEVVGRLDGRQSLEELWRALLDQLGDDAPSQSDVLRILGQLTEADLLQAESVPDIRRLAEHGNKRARAEQRARMNPLSFRVTLFDPSALLQRLDPLAHALFNRWAAIAWTLLVLAGAWVAGSHLDEIVAHARGSLPQPHVLLMMWAAYPVLKAIHELGHALALQRWQCDTHEVGVTFLLLMPLPYVDATASLRLGSRGRRAVIAGAGIAVELACASLAALAWVMVEPGTLRDLALVVMTLGGLSTLAFNGNPLLRYDGYYLLCDVADMPNLAGRSATWWREAVRRLLLRVFGARRPAALPRNGDRVEQAALFAYAPASWAYRMVLGVVVVGVLAGWSPWLAAAGALWLAWSTLVQPIWRWVELVGATPQLEPVRLRARLLVGGGLVAVVLLVGWMPMPVSLRTEGIVWLPEEAQLRTRVPAQVVQVLARDGQWVRRGQPLIRMEEPALATERAVQSARIDADEAERNAAWGVEPVRVRQAEEMLVRDRAALADVDKRMADLVLRAADDGIFVLPTAADMLLRDVDQGELLGYVLPRSAPRVRAVVSERDVELWREALRTPQGRVSVVLGDQPGVVQLARVLRAVPAAIDKLPAAALGEHAGGSIPTDPDDPEGLRPQQPVFVFELELPELAVQRIGARAEVKLQLPPQALAQRAYFRARQLLLRHFANV
jgi:putative peptide zinc metalloprotease protein